MEKKLLTAITILAVFTSLFLLFIFSGNNTGLFSLAGEPSDSPVLKMTDKPPAQKIRKENAGLSAGLSFQIIEDTKLLVELVEGQLRDCPHYSPLVFKIANSGQTASERLFVKYPSNLLVSKCINCSAKQIEPKKSLTVTLYACKSEKEQIPIEFSSINSETETVLLPEKN